MTKPYVQSGEPLHEFLHAFWQRQVDAAEQETPDYRHPPLPLARIKKVMKSDPDVKMIAADGLFSPYHPPPRILYRILQRLSYSARLVKSLLQRSQRERS
ncbi:hypothetical protein BJV78DRAFT_1251564 [Lactifluus subvellereus]|nr:hypothetical protein BJV78DRAFT_1251564 [Lactifluus subvellereus]